MELLACDSPSAWPIKQKAGPGRSSAIGEINYRRGYKLQATSLRLEISRLPIQNRAQNDKAATSHQQPPSP
jgi:hypothetical protein